MRKLFAAVAVLAALAAGVVAEQPARANSNWCGDGFPTEVSPPSPGPYAAVEVYNSFVTSGRPATDDTWINVCYSDTPQGSSPSSDAVGGAVTVRLMKETTPNTYRAIVACYGDGGWLANVVCRDDIVITTSTSTSASPSSAGASAGGFANLEGSTVNLFTTGAQSGTLSTTSGTSPSVTYGGTCTTVAGVTPPGTMCTTGAVGAKTSTSDLTPGSGPSGTAVCFVRDSSGTCIVGVPKVNFILFKDAANPTEVTVLGVTHNDPGPLCVGLC